jgi:hypothetical protein
LAFELGNEGALDLPFGRDIYLTEGSSLRRQDTELGICEPGIVGVQVPAVLQQVIFLE